MTISGENNTAVSAASSTAPPGAAEHGDELVIAGPSEGLPSWVLSFAPTIVAAIAIAMLWAGGAAAGFGAWLLAAGFPIALGAVTRKPHFAALPAVIWTAWLIIVQVVPESTDIARTPLPLALTLAAVGVGATLLAQRAIAPALERAAWLPPQPRVAPSIDAALDEELDASPGDEDADVHELVVEAIELTPEEAAAAEPVAIEDEDEPDVERDAETEDEDEDEDEDSVTGEAEPEDAAADNGDDELEVITSEDLAAAAEASAKDDDAPSPPLPAATQAGRGRRTSR